MEIKIVKQILEWNEDVSDKVSETLKANHVALINVLGSPGAGKTSLIMEMIKDLRDEFNIGVIEGDIAGDIDAKKMVDIGIPAVQLQTDGACHIEAESIMNMLPLFDLENLDVIFVENIGNLVCPAEFDIGENLRIALLSIPEGDDKVIKYPLMFEKTDALVLNKYDMKPYFDFDDGKVERDEKDANPFAKVFRISTKDRAGMDELINWLRLKLQSITDK